MMDKYRLLDQMSALNNIRKLLDVSKANVYRANVIPAILGKVNRISMRISMITQGISK